MFGDWKRDCRSRTLVDSALAGSQAEESFFSAPVSLPDNGAATATMISQKTSTAHLVRRPLATPAIPRTRLISHTPDNNSCLLSAEVSYPVPPAAQSHVHAPGRSVSRPVPRPLG